MNQLNAFDFTIPSANVSVQQVKDFLKGWAKHWTFQHERGDTGYEHYQGRLSLIKKRRPEELINLTKDILPFHWTPTSNGAKGDMLYVLKEDTRIDGPWTDKDKVIYIPRQIREIEQLYPWQQQVIDSAKIWDTRKINLIIDERGNHGKSILKTYVGVHEIGRCVPFVNDYRDIMRIVMDTKKMPLYIIDMPRAVNKERLYGLMSGIETLKDGYAYDDRYTFKEEYFDCPQIWVFSNKVVDTSYLSLDRWVFWTINDNNELVDYNEFIVQNLNP